MRGPMVNVSQSELEEVMADVPGGGDAQQRLFSMLTADHSRRMERLGLTP